MNSPTQKELIEEILVLARLYGIQHVHLVVSAIVNQKLVGVKV